MFILAFGCIKIEFTLMCLMGRSVRVRVTLKGKGRCGATMGMDNTHLLFLCACTKPLHDLMTNHKDF